MSPSAIGGEAEPLSFLYPPIEPYQSGLLPVGDDHAIWWEVSGNPDGVPVVYLHGGPGAPPNADHRRFFDPKFYRLVILHQRGCGKSTPHASVADNTTWRLIADIEQLRAHLGVEAWLVVGGSWGSCLALAYGETHPDRCLGFRLRGVSLGRKSEIDWWWTGTRMVFPEAYDELMAFLPPKERSAPLAAYHSRLIDPDPGVHLPAAQAIKLFSGRTVHIRENKGKQAEAFQPRLALPLARFFAHYSINEFFLDDNQILRDIHRINHLPCVIVHGRFDVTTPADNAWALHKAWPGSIPHIVAEASHDELDPPLARVMLDAHEYLKVHVHGRG